MEIYHLSAECYPIAKVGGLADVVGALPKYLTREGHAVKVVLPGYTIELNVGFEEIFNGNLQLGMQQYMYSVEKETQNKLGFECYRILISGLFDRDQIYGYSDDTERFCAFQIAALDWIVKTEARPDLIHCHDHHTGLIPFMIRHCTNYQSLCTVPVVLTIHNAQYQGQFGFDKISYLPDFDPINAGYLEWNEVINPLASALKCANAVTTVSPSYLAEMQQHANGLENLLRFEQGKSSGILNGIDTEVWNTQTDPLLSKNYAIKNYKSGKAANKKALCTIFGLDEKLPLFAFIGRLVYEKGADLLPEAIRRILTEYPEKGNVLLLGSGDPEVEERLRALQYFHRENYNCYIGYNEKLAHQVYAGVDFLLMPSRVEPCGLNQMYSLAYGTIPIVRRTGGLRDTVLDIGDGGWGICHDQASVEDILHSVNRALELYSDEKALDNIRKKGMKIDHSWESVARKYMELYTKLKR